MGISFYCGSLFPPGALKLKNPKDSSISDSSFRNFTGNLQPQTGAVIFHDTDRQFYADFSKSLNAIQASIAYKPESDNDTPDPEESISDATRFSVNKIEHLKRLSSCARDGDYLFHDFRLKRRMENIKASLVTINTGIKDLVV
jgi:hypothetical protein